MKKIDKLYVDVANKVLVLKDYSWNNMATGNNSIVYKDHDTGNTLNGSFKFDSIAIDSSATFNCKEEPSSSALKTLTISNYIDSNGNFSATGDINEKPAISFDDITISDDIPNELLFIWLKESFYITGNETPYALGIVDIYDGATLIGSIDCRYDNYDFVIALSVETFYKLLLNTININSCNPCKDNVSCSYVNTMLAWDGFNLAKSTRNYKRMVYYWNIVHNSSNKSNNNCKCR